MTLNIDRHYSVGDKLDIQLMVENSEYVQLKGKIINTKGKLHRIEVNGTITVEEDNILISRE